MTAYEAANIRQRGMEIIDIRGTVQIKLIVMEALKCFDLDSPEKKRRWRVGPGRGDSEKDQRRG